MNFSSTEISSDKDVDFCLAKTLVAAPLSWLNVTTSKYLICSCEK